MDAFGFAYASAFLAIVLTIFGIVGRILNGVASELRWGLAPALVDGFKAWGDELRVARRSSSDGASPDDAGGPDGDTVTDPRDPGLVVPVQAVSRRARHLFARVVRSLATARRRTLTGLLLVAVTRRLVRGLGAVSNGARPGHASGRGQVNARRRPVVVGDGPGRHPVLAGDRTRG